MATRTVTGYIERPSGVAWSDAPVRFRLTPGSYDATTQYPEDVVTVRTAMDGTFSVQLWTNEEGETASAYDCSLPSGESFTFTVPAGDDPVELSVLRLLGITPADPQHPTLLTQIDTRFAGHLDSIEASTASAAASAGSAGISAAGAAASALAAGNSATVASGAEETAVASAGAAAQSEATAAASAASAAASEGVATAQAEIATSRASAALASRGAAEASALAAAASATDALSAGGVKGFATLAALNADLAHAAGTVALVTNDPTATNNGLYLKSGASGSGGWGKSALDLATKPETIGGALADSRLMEIVRSEGYASVSGVVRNAAGVLTRAAVAFPGGQAGTLVATEVGTGAGWSAVNAFSVFVGERAVRQPTITRDAAGAITSAPALTIGPALPASLLRDWRAEGITAVADGGSVDTLPDAVAASHATAATTLRGTYRTGQLNGLPSLRFDGVDDAYTIPDIGPVATFDVWFLGRFSDLVNRTLLGKGVSPGSGAYLRLTNATSVLMTNDANVGTAITVPAITTDYALYHFRANAGTFAIYRNGVLLGSKAMPADSTVTFNRIGRKPGSTAHYFFGDIVQLLMDTSGLSLSAAAGVSAYLMARGGLT